MPLMLSELLSFAKECMATYGDIPVFMRLDGDDEDLYTTEEMRLVRDSQNKQMAFVIADYELGEEGLKPRLSLIKT